MAAGRLHRCHRGVYRSGPEIDVPFGPETSALLALWEGAILCHQTAAVLWGLLAHVAAEALPGRAAQNEFGSPGMSGV